MGVFLLPIIFFTKIFKNPHLGVLQNFFISYLWGVNKKCESNKR